MSSLISEEALLDDELVEFKGGTLTLSTENDYNEHCSLLHPKNSDNSLALVPGVGGDPKSFFCYRNELVAKAIDDVREFLTEDDPERVQGVWLLTEISFWDNERERIAALTQNDLFVIKYDFIALKILNHYRIPLRNIDTLTVGDLVYPSGSLAPHFHDEFFYALDALTKTRCRNSCIEFLYRIGDESNGLVNKEITLEIRTKLELEKIVKSRNVTGVRAMWNKGEPLKFSVKWNPFANNIPWVTFTSHPLLWHKSVDDDNIGVYDVDNFVARFVKTVQQTPRASLCQIQHKPILLQNYFGLFSIIHNRNGLGFFKIRGKFSF